MIGQATTQQIVRIGKRGLTDMLGDDSQFHVHFQPQINLATGNIEAAEALARWDHPAWGPVPAYRLVRAIDELHLQGMLFKRVAGLVLAAAKRLGDAGAVIPVAINACAAALSDPDNLDYLREAAARYGIEPSRVKIELTEGAAVADLAALKASLARLKQWGCEISMDDFGAGHANLGLLMSLNIDELKLDKQFTLNATKSRVAQQSIRFALELAKEMNWRVVAEGISTAAERCAMYSLGCRHGQGFHLGSPMSLRRLMDSAGLSQPQPSHFPDGDAAPGR